MIGITAIIRITTIAAACAVVEVGEQLVEELVAEHVGVEVAVGHHVDDVEDLHHADQHGDEDGDDRALDLRDDDLEEDLPLVGAVDAGRLERVAGHALDRRGEQHHREADLRPEQHHHQQEAVEVERGSAAARRPGRSRSAARSAFSRPICGWPAGRGVVDEAPDRRRADDADRHRQEDDRLGELLAARAEPVGEGRDREPEDDASTAGTMMIQSSVLNSVSLEAGVGEQVGVVLEADPLGASERSLKLLMNVRIAG